MLTLRRVKGCAAAKTKRIRAGPSTQPRIAILQHYGQHYAQSYTPHYRQGAVEVTFDDIGSHYWTFFSDSTKLDDII